MSEEENIDQCAEKLGELGCIKSAEQLSVFANLLAIAISKDKNSDQLNVIGNFVTAVGALILAMAAERSSCEEKLDKLQQIRDLKRQIKDLEDSLTE
jgi:mannitol/fructose-specific phosphotransferase system IIA component (Ntr-type)